MSVSAAKATGSSPGSAVFPGSVLFRNVRVVLPHGISPECDVEVRDGRIAAIGTGASAHSGAEIVMGGGRYLAPGFIDIHCHGDGENSIFGLPEAVAERLVSRGTTGVLATLGYTDMEEGNLHGQVLSMWGARGPWAERAVLGVHLEGPYLNPRYGANQRLRKVRPPNPVEYRAVLDQCGAIVRFWTCAPEVEGVPAFAAEVAASGILLAAGHTEAGADAIEALVPSGLRVATHWTNATGAPRTRYGGTREPGIDELALASEDILAEVICDSGGRHVRPLMMRVLYRAKGPDGIILISDASHRRPGDKTPANADVNISVDGELAGSRLFMIDSARNFRRSVGCGLPEIFRMGSLNAARLFGWNRELGSVEPGKLANLVLVDDQLELHGTWVHGKRGSPAAC